VLKTLSALALFAAPALMRPKHRTLPLPPDPPPARSVRPALPPPPPDDEEENRPKPSKALQLRAPDVPPDSPAAVSDAPANDNLSGAELDAEMADEMARTVRVFEQLGMPLKPVGVLRAPELPQISARRFVTYMRALHPRSEPMPFEQVKAAYLRFCRLDHRRPANVNEVMGAVPGPGCWRREVKTRRPDGTMSYNRTYYFGTMPKGGRKRTRKVKVKRAEPVQLAEAA
jgi:hypothetical protein